MRDGEGREGGAAVVQRDDGGRDDQARGDLPEDEDLPADGVREQEVAGPLLVLRDERVRREQNSTEDDKQTGEHGKRRDDGVRGRGVRDAEGRREPDE